MVVLADPLTADLQISQGTSNGFGLPIFIEGTFKQLPSDVKLSSTATIGRYTTELIYTQPGKIVDGFGFGIEDVLIANPETMSFTMQFTRSVANACPFNICLVQRHARLYQDARYQHHRRHMDFSIANDPAGGITSLSARTFTPAPSAIVKISKGGRRVSQMKDPPLPDVSTVFHNFIYGQDSNITVQGRSAGPLKLDVTKTVVLDDLDMRFTGATCWDHPSTTESDIAFIVYPSSASLSNFPSRFNVSVGGREFRVGGPAHYWTMRVSFTSPSRACRFLLLGLNT
ncbi:hypothetical protein PENSPDRAFT_693610 [Peniophora sp. CONT]|nr:hypothetical protein PENSPDRAFT_693610 [Peniophora sp. CONT]